MAQLDASIAKSTATLAVATNKFKVGPVTTVLNERNKALKAKKVSGPTHYIT